MPVEFITVASTDKHRPTKRFPDRTDASVRVPSSVSASITFAECAPRMDTKNIQIDECTAELSALTTRHPHKLDSTTRPSLLLSGCAAPATNNNV